MKLADYTGRKRSAYGLIAGIGLLFASELAESTFQNRTIVEGLQIGLCVAGLLLILTLLRTANKQP